LGSSGWSAIDVRDLAAIHATCIEKRPGARLYVCGGPYLTWRGTAERLRALTGRRIPLGPGPRPVFRGLGRVMDLAGSVVPFETAFSHEAMVMATQWIPTDDSGVAEELGIHWRDPSDTLAAALRSLYEGGVLTAKQVGRLAA